MLPIKTLSATTQAEHAKGQQALMDANWAAFGKSLLAFVGRFLLIYALLMAPWPGLAEGYAKFYQTGGNFLFAKLDAKGIALFHPFSEASQFYDTQIFLVNRDQISPDGEVYPKIIYIHSRYHGYMPTVFLIALIFATPLSWSRRRWALLCGMILIHLAIIFKLLIFILYYFYETPRLNLFQAYPPWTGLLRIAYELFVQRFNMSLIFAVMIWLLVSFRREQ